MNRRAVKLFVVVLLYVTGGAIVNVAVAWGCVCWAPYDPGRVDKIESASWQAPVPDDWPLMAGHKRELVFGMTRFTSRGGPPLDRPSSRTNQWVLRAGWPFRTFFIERHRAFNVLDSAWEDILWWRDPDDWREGFVIPETVPWVRREPGRFLPAVPLWPGVLVNTLFYAAILWLIFAAPFALGRKRRRKCGLCPACAYPIGTSDVCTECGSEVKRLTT